jgi:hypothetical protein
MKEKISYCVEYHPDSSVKSKSIPVRNARFF